MPHKTSKQSHHYVLISLLIVFVGALLWLATHQQTVRDWYILASYKPASEISRLAQVDGMTTYGRNLFYVNRPQLDSKQQFALYCPNASSQTYVLGCYHSGDNGIFLLSVSNPTLKGIDSVTAAYEMLHAGYARLSTNNRLLIDKQMEKFYAQHVSEPQIHQQMAAYAATEPGAKYDELYSVLGTEVSNLPLPLENDYKIYFNNRQNIVSKYNNYESNFTSRLNKIKHDDQQLAVLKNSINTGEAKLSSYSTQINNLKQTMSDEISAGNNTAYNNNVIIFNTLVDDYNSLVSTITSNIASYNQIVNNRNTIALEEQQLVKAIDSTPQPQALK